MRVRDEAPFVRNLAVALGLLLLLAISAASAYAPLGAWNAAINLGIAALKIALIAAFFMRLARAEALMRFAAGAALVMLALFFGLAAADFLTRGGVAAPWQAPAQRRQG